MKPKHGNLFTGIGVWDKAAQAVGWENVFQVEKDKKCLDLLRKRYPGTFQHTDTRHTDYTIYKNKIDVLTMSDPCTKLSLAGRQDFETSADGYLWPQAYRAVREIRPGYIISENVCDRRYLDADRVISDLENEGYTVEPPMLMPALSAGAKHERYRFFLIAYANGKRWTDELYSYEPAQINAEQYQRDDTLHNAVVQFELCTNESALLRVDDGITKRLDVSWRVGALGNALYYPLAFRLCEAVNHMINCEIK